MILVCDGFKLTKPGKKPRMKGGLVSQQIADGYTEVIAWLRQQTDPSSQSARTDSSRLLEMVPRLELLEMAEWRGWSSAVEHALRLVDTPHVMVVQDDRRFTRRMVDLGLVLAALSAQAGAVAGDKTATAADDRAEGADGGPEAVGYVLLPTRKQKDYAARMRTEAGQRGVKMQPDTLSLPPASISVVQSSAGVNVSQAGMECNGGRDDAERHVQRDTCICRGDDDNDEGSEVTGRDGEGCLRLVRCWRILDSTHVASTAWYRNLYQT